MCVLESAVCLVPLFQLRAQSALSTVSEKLELRTAELAAHKEAAKRLTGSYAVAHEHMSEHLKKQDEFILELKRSWMRIQVNLRHGWCRNMV